MNRNAMLVAALVLPLSACATNSFAPPQVNVHKQMTHQSLSRACRLTDAVGKDIGKDVEGALALVSNFLDAYRCTMRLAADGRQGFEIPSFFSLVGATTAVALGAGPDVAIIGGAGNSVFTAGNKYFAPQEQTDILADAVNALACIETEAVGVSAFDVATTAAQERVEGRSAAGGAVEITVERQYYNMVEAALINVERAATARLSRRGSFDTAGVAAEIETLVQKIRDAEEARKKPPVQDQETVNMLGTNKAAAVRSAQRVQLELNLLQPKLEKCVVRAKA